MTDFMGHAPSPAIGSTERVKGQITDCSFTTARCVDVLEAYSDNVVHPFVFNTKDKLQTKFPANIVRNQKYNVFTFLPIVFYEQFKFFFNLYFLLVALSQFIPALRTGKPAFPLWYRCCRCPFLTHL
jgi:Phospholipid-translocating ATPase N-terminal